jgi:hypothetical protein
MDVDGGFLFEPRQVLAVGYRTLRSLQCQSAGLALDYASQHLAGSFEPHPDDLNVMNDVEVARRDGSSSRQTLDSGALSTQAPPDGVGLYDAQFTLNAETDDHLPQLAGWLLHLGTWDEERFPSLEVWLERAVFAASASLTASARALDLGDVATVDNPPAWLPQDQIRLIVQGCREHINKWEHRLQWNTTPAGPFDVAVLDSDTYAKLDTEGSQLLSDTTSGATSVNVATTSGPPWTTAAGEFPFDVRFGGERATATAIADQTLTFVAAGTVAHANNASVTPTLPAGCQAGDLLLILAAIRNSGAGIPDTPTLYQRLDVFNSTSNVQMYGRIHSGSESDPTVTFTGGVANADTSAQMVAFRSTFRAASKVVVASRAILNDTLQDIPYPQLPVRYDNCAILYVGWKQDDWTSVATIAGAAEIGEPDTTTGDDQGIVWDYVIQTSAADIPSGSFTVTGGAAAISRGAVVAIRSDVQTFTLTRSVNGVVKAHDAGTPLGLQTPARLAL